MQSSGTLRNVALVRTDIPPKRLFLQKPHDVTSQETAFFTVMCLVSGSIQLKLNNNTLESKMFMDN
jgi:hypothetical protein